jgi:hypothetical protein
VEIKSGAEQKMVLRRRCTCCDSEETGGKQNLTQPQKPSSKGRPARPGEKSTSRTLRRESPPGNGLNTGSGWKNQGRARNPRTGEVTSRQFNTGKETSDARNKKIQQNQNRTAQLGYKEMIFFNSNKIHTRKSPSSLTHLIIRNKNPTLEIAK